MYPSSGQTEGGARPASRNRPQTALQRSSRTNVDIEDEAYGVVVGAAYRVRHTRQQPLDALGAARQIAGNVHLQRAICFRHIDAMSQEQSGDCRQVVFSLDVEGRRASGGRHYRGSMSLLSIRPSDSPVNGAL